jgi:hypothetical protein
MAAAISHEEFPARLMNVGVLLKSSRMRGGVLEALLDDDPSAAVRRSCPG